MKTNYDSIYLYSRSRCITSSCEKYIGLIGEKFTFSSPRNRCRLVNEDEKKVRFMEFFTLELTQITTAIDIYSLGMVTLEVLKIFIIINKRFYLNEERID
jgi:hypothetical protein